MTSHLVIEDGCGQQTARYKGNACKYRPTVLAHEGKPSATDHQAKGVAKH
jgi:hypothetical protein